MKTKFLTFLERVREREREREGGGERVKAKKMFIEVKISFLRNFIIVIVYSEMNILKTVV